MRLDQALPELSLTAVTDLAGIEADGIVLDSRRVRPGVVFAALPGLKGHGLDHLDEALVRGAVAVLSDRPRPAGLSLPWIVSQNPRAATAAVAWALAGEPQRRLDLVGVTGTNGKSTTAQLVHSILGAAGVGAALLGTLSYLLPDGAEVAAERTTPEATELAPLFARTVAAGGRAVVMEASSHALAQHRLDGLGFRVAVWTNLTRDHLDFHGDMERYFAAKRRLFDERLAADGRRVLAAGDPWAARLAATPRTGDLSWGLISGDVRAEAVEADLEGTRFRLVLPGAEAPVRLALLGEHNLANALAAAAAAHALELPVAAIRAGLEAARSLPGRLERVAVEASFPVFVDYAHTPEGLRTVLTSLRRLTDRRLLVVFGAGGDRDPGKRGPMGAAVGELADLAIVTSDNPRSEDPAAIAAAVAAGVRSAGAVPLVELDRRRAIALALAEADDRCLVLVAGKGHEAVQTIGDRVLPFSDHEVIRDEAGRVRCG